MFFGPISLTLFFLFSIGTGYSWAMQWHLITSIGVTLIFSLLIIMLWIKEYKEIL
jgi:hypothetical protein